MNKANLKLDALNTTKFVSSRYFQFMRTVLLLSFLSLLLTSCNSVRIDSSDNSNNNDSLIQISSSPVDGDIVDTILYLQDTTITLGNYQLSFQKTDSIQLPELYIDAKVREGIISQFDNSFEAAKAVEKYIEKPQGKYFQRTAFGLNLLLSNGQQLTLADDAGKGEYYTYEHYHPKLDAFVICVHWDEGNTYMLVNRSNGFKKYVVGQVYPSPEGKQAFAIREDLISGYGSNGFEFLRMQADSLVSSLIVESGNWAPVGVKWLTDFTLILKTKTLLDSDSLEYKTEYYKLTIK